MERQTNYSLLERFSDGMKDCTSVKFPEPARTCRKHELKPRLNFNLWWLSHKTTRARSLQDTSQSNTQQVQELSLPIFVSHPSGTPPS